MNLHSVVAAAFALMAASTAALAQGGAPCIFGAKGQIYPCTVGGTLVVVSKPTGDLFGGGGGGGNGGGGAGGALIEDPQNPGFTFTGTIAGNTPGQLSLSGTLSLATVSGLPGLIGGSASVTCGVTGAATASLSVAVGNGPPLVLTCPALASQGATATVSGNVTFPPLGSLTETITISATVPASGGSMTLSSFTVQAAMNPGAPLIDSDRTVENGASYTKGQAVAAGSFVVIYGKNFAPATFFAPSVPLPSSLANVSVTFNNIPAPVVAVNQNQINAQVPWNILPPGAQTGTAQVVVTANGANSAPVMIPITSAAPGLFFVAQDSTGVARPAAYNNGDYTLPLPAGVSFPGYTSRPAKVGDPATLVLLATGLGPVTVTPPAGAPPTQESDTLTKPVVLVGRVPAQVVFSGLSPQFPSIYQLNVVLQPGTPVGDAVPVQIQMNGITTTDQLKIAVSN